MSEHDLIYSFPTVIGSCALRWTDAGVTAVQWPDHSKSQSRPGEHGAPAPAAIRAAADAISKLLSGDRVDLRFVALDTARLEDFARDVYAAAREIPAGETTSYGELARASGHPGAAREVGAVLARNPFPIVVPCHRVLAADGALHGFSAPGGIATKRRMLEIEGAPGFEQQPLFA